MKLFDITHGFDGVPEAVSPWMALQKLFAKILFATIAPPTSPPMTMQPEASLPSSNSLQLLFVSKQPTRTFVSKAQYPSSPLLPIIVFVTSELAVVKPQPAIH